jgi:AcrR family transcriptional regulator
MTSSRRVGSDTSKTRALLLDRAEELILDEGNAAVTYRSLAGRAGVTAALVQYYFPSLDDLFVALLRRRSDRNHERLVEALRDRPDEPLRVIWEYNQDETSASLFLEFLVLANYRKSIRAEIDRLIARIRETQLAALCRTWSGYELPDDDVSPELLVFLLSAIPKMLLVEEDVGLSTAHVQMLNLVKRYIDRLEPRPAVVDAPLTDAKQSRSLRDRPGSGRFNAAKSRPGSRP